MKDQYKQISFTIEDGDVKSVFYGDEEFIRKVNQAPEQQAIIELSERVEAIESNAIDKNKVKILMQMSTILDRVEKLEKKINSNIVLNPIMGINCNNNNKAIFGDEPIKLGD